MANTPKLSIRLPEELRQQVEHYGTSELITSSEVIRLALLCFFAQPPTVGQSQPVSDTKPAPVSDTPRVQPQPNAHRNQGKDFSKYKQATNGKGKKA